MSAPTTAMVLAAGLGARMRPLTDDRPKALVEVGGRALIDHMLDRLAEAGVTRAVVNVHAFADRLEDHLRGRELPAIVISDERGRVLETGGGLKRARPLVGDAPIFVANIDSVWIETGKPALAALAGAWDPERMDALLLLTPTQTALGFDGPGDFFLAAPYNSPQFDGEVAQRAEGAARRAEDAAATVASPAAPHAPSPLTDAPPSKMVDLSKGAAPLTFRGDRPTAPFAYIGVHIAKPQIVDDEPDDAFSLTPVWRRLAARGRLYGLMLDGAWMHVGDPQARDAAEARLAEAATR
jgi:MurNAc alpha-1-phosphate uridylyltransferase